MIALALILALAGPRLAADQPASLPSKLRWQWNVFWTQVTDNPSSEVTALVPGPEGELWVGTVDGGLARLHEGFWELFTAENSDLPDDQLRDLALEPGGGLWVATHGGGLARFHEGSWEVFTTENSDLPDDRVTALALGPEGVLWVGTFTGGLARLHEDSWQVFTPENSDLPDDLVQELAVGPEGELWIDTLNGLARLQDGSWQVFTTQNSGLPGGALSLEPARDGDLWVGTAGSLARLHEGSWEVFTPQSSELPRGQVWSLAAGPKGELWAGTAGGLARFHDGSWEVFTPDDSDLPNGVTSLAVGSKGEVWAGTYGGDLVRLHESPWEVFTSTNSDLREDRVNVLALGPKRGLWVGTESGLARLHEGEWKTFSLEGLWVTSLAQEPGGNLWAGTMRGLAGLHDGSWEVLTPVNSLLPNDWVTSLALGPEGELWVGTQDIGGPKPAGLARFDERSWKVFTAADRGLPHNYVTSLALGPDDELWVGTEGGLGRFADGTWEVFTEENSDLPGLVTTLAIGSGGELWVGTSSGLARLQERAWTVFTVADSGLPDDWILSLEPGPERELWIGTKRGLARLHEGFWQTFTPANSDLPDDEVSALASSPTGNLWVGTHSGLARFRFSEQHPRIVNLVGAVEGERGQRITQDHHTFAAMAFDPTYRTEGREWRFLWRLEDPSGGVTTVERHSPYFEARLGGDGDYTLSVQAIDVNGFRSAPRVHEFEVALPEQTPVEVWATRGAAWGSLLAGAYFLTLFPLLVLYPHAGWARSLVNSGTFTRFPVLHRIVLESAWARRKVFRRLAEGALTAGRVPEPYIPQRLMLGDREPTQRLAMDASSESLQALFGTSRKLLVLGRSGTGKSVLLRFLEREMARRFLAGEDSRLPIFIDLRTSPVGGRGMEALIRDVLKGGGGRSRETAGVELPDPLLNYLVAKGGFILLIDSLNELPSRRDLQALHPFFNRDPANFTVIASQADLLERTDFSLHRLAAVTEDQARDYLAYVVGRDAWRDLPVEARALTSNPQDLELLAEVLRAIGPERPLPSHRAELYREILLGDTLSAWARAGGAVIHALYGLAFRMVREQRVVGEEQLREWLRAELVDRDAFSEEAMAELEAAIGTSRLFRREEVVDVLGQHRPVTGFRHELIGKFLASRHVREALSSLDAERRRQYVALSCEDDWSEVFYFIIDELESRTALVELLRELLEQECHRPLRVVAYAIGSRSAEMIPDEIHRSYGRAKLGEDIAQTPAGGAAGRAHRLK